MKKFLLAYCIVMASCYFGEIEAVPEATKLSIQNNSSVQLISVLWKDSEFGDIGLGRVSTKEVSDGHSYVYFNTSNSKQYRTRELVVCKKYRHEPFRFADEMLIIDTGTNERITLKEVIEAKDAN